MTLLDFKDLEEYQNDFIMYIHFNMVSIHHITPDSYQAVLEFKILQMLTTLNLQ